MRIQRIKDLGALSDTDYVNWKRQALQDGYITDGTSLSQMSRLYQMQQIQNAGLDPNLSLDQANAILATRQFSQLLKDGQVGGEIAPLLELYNHNPELASKLATQLFDSGYLTLDEINQRAETPLSESGYEGGQGWNTFYKGAHDLLGKIPLVGGINEAILGGVDKLDEDKKSLEEYDSKAFKYYYDQVEKEREGVRTKVGTEEEQEESIYKEARRRYLSAQNSNIYKDIQTQIDNYYQNEVEAKAPEIEQAISQMTPQELVTRLSGEGAVSLLNTADENNRPLTPFDILAGGSQETVPSAYGDVTVLHPGSNYWRAYKGTSVFTSFGDQEKKQIMSRYLAYKELLGEDKANEYLETAMQTYVAQNRGWGKAIADVAGGVGTTAGLIIPEALVGVGGLAYDMLGAVLPENYGGQWAKNQASIMLTGRDLQGNAVETQDFDKAMQDQEGLAYSLFGHSPGSRGLNAIGNVLNWLGSRANMGYLNKVSQYKNWDIEQIQKAEANGGVSKDAMYTVDPTKGWQFKNDALDMLDMTGQALGQIALAYATSGASLDAKAAQTMGKMAATARVGAEIATTTAPIASAYAVGAANEAFNNTLNTARDMAYQQAQSQFTQVSQTEEYQQQRKEAIDKYFNQKGRKGLDGTVYLAPFESEEARKQQEQMYDSQYIEGLANDILEQRKDETNQIAQNSSLLAYRASASIEALKYGYTTAMFGSWKLSGNANKLLEQNLGVKTYGNLTQNSAGKFIREAIHPLGIKKLTLKSPNQIAAWKTAESAIIGGGVSNYTDDVTTGFAVGLSLGYSNSALLREYDPQAFAETWYGDSEAAQALHILGSGIQGANDMIKSGQPWHSFYIGVGGSFLGAGFRFRGRDDVRRQYAEQNAQYEAETGKQVSKFTKFRQGVNTYTQTLWSTYEDARMGVNRLDQNIKVYNETLDKRQDALNEIASMRQGLIKRKYEDNEMSFSDATLESDNLALKLISIQHSLQANPLRELDKQRFDNELTELYDIAEDNVSDEKKESLIQSAYGQSEQDKSKPLTDQRKAEIWEDIKANAKRFSDFSSDYYEAVDQLKYRDGSLAEPGNWPLLHQKAELIAKTKRIQRDIDTLSKEVGVNVDTQVTDRTQGELTEVARQSSIKAAQETIEKLREQRQEAQEKVDELSAKEALTEAESEELLKQQALIMRADRSIPRLEAEVEGLEEGTTMAQANSGLTTNVIQLHNMLSSPELYTTEQQGQINRFRTQIGDKGVLYVEEMAKMQDQLNEMKDAQEALDAHPETFQALVTGLQGIREVMGQKAIYNTRLQTQFNILKGLAPQEMGSNSAVALTTEQFDQFIRENPELSDILTPYKEINTAFSHIYSLTQEARQSDALDETTQRDILRTMQSLAIQDSEYLLDNGRQGVADMLEFLIATDIQNPAEVEAMKNLLTDFKRVAAIQQSTRAYTEYKIKKMAQQSQELADKLINELERVQQQDQQAEAKEEVESQEEVPDMASMDNETGAAIDLEDTGETETSTEVEEETNKESKGDDEVTETAAEPKAQETEELPAGVTRNSEGNIETMTVEQQAEQLGITKVAEDSMIDDSAPKVQEITEQQEEVHGCYFNMYEGQALNMGELVPFTDGLIYNWLAKEGINLGAIIDNELSHILKTKPKVQLMKVKKDGDDANVASNVFLVVEYTDKVAKHHLPENGGVITSNGKQYLIVGTMWNTKSQEGTEAANLMQATRSTLQRNGVDYFDANPSERFYVDPVMNTEVTTFYSGHIVHTVDGESHPHTIAELLDEHNRTHATTDHMDTSDLGFGVITMKDGFYPVGPHSADKIHAPQRQTVDKYGQVYVLVPAANGEIVPIFINPTLLSETRESELKQRIDTVLLPQLLSEDYFVREQAISELCQLLCITGSITNPEGKGILIGTRDIATVSLVNGKSIICTFDIKNSTLKFSDGRVNQNPSIKDFIDAVYALNPRINLSLSNLAQSSWIQRYDEAGALTTDAAKLGTFGGKYYVAPINPATGQPLKVEQKTPTQQLDSDYSRAQSTPTMLPVGGQTYVLRDGKWVHQEDGSAVTDKAEQAQVIWAYRVQTGEAQLAKRVGQYDYYTTGIETSEPVVVAYNLSTRKYEGVHPDIASQIVAERRAEIEKARADAEAQRLLNQQEESLEVDTAEQSVTEVVESQEEVQPFTVVEEVEQTDSQKDTTVEQKNDFELEQTANQDKYSVDQILDSTDDAMMEYADKIFEIIESKIATSEKWKDFDMSNITAELERLNIDTSNIEDVESWIDNLEHCE